MARRYSVPVVETPRQTPVSGFTWGWLANLLAIPALTVVSGFLVGWVTLGITVSRNVEEIKEIRVEAKADRAAFLTAIKTDRDLVESRVSQEKSAREGVRNEFLDSQRKNIEVLGKLDSRLAVAEKQQDTTNQLLGRLVESVQRVPPGRGR